MLKKSHLIFLTFLFSLTSSLIINAQQAGINFSLAIPKGEFGQQVDNIGYGLSGEFMFLSPGPRSPLGFGLNIGYYVYGRESRREPWSLTIPDVFVDVTRTNNLLNFHFVLELGIPAGKIRPYVQGLIGGSYLYTETSVRGEYNQDNIASSINYYDWAWSYGGGGGISILISGNTSAGIGEIYLDLKGRYLFGSEAVYLKEGGVNINGTRVIYRPSISKTDILSIHLGIRANINI